MDLVQWLESLKGITDVYPVAITIGKETFEGASYVQYEEQRFYVLGTLPKCYKKRKSVCFTVGDETWYIAGYFQKGATEFHPLGNHWLCFRWSCEEAIDEYEKYHKYEIKVDSLSR